MHDLMEGGHMSDRIIIGDQVIDLAQGWVATFDSENEMITLSLPGGEISKTGRQALDLYAHLLIGCQEIDNTELQRGESNLPKTPDIQFRKTYQRRYDSQDPQS